MALKRLKQLMEELSQLRESLKQETDSDSRILLFHRATEIFREIERAA